MKKYLFLLVSVLAVAFSVSCSRFEEQVNLQEKNSNYSVTFMCDWPEEAVAEATRTQFGPENGITWSEGDELLFSQVATVSGVPNTVQSAPYVLAASCSQLPAMPVNFTEPDEGTDAYYFAVFPSTAFGQKMHDENGIQCPLLTIPVVQKPSLNNFDPNADVLLSEITNVVSVVNEERYVQLHFTRPSAIGKMKLLSIPSEHNLKTITFTATADGKTVQVGGTHYYDLTRGDFSRSYDDENCCDIPVVTLDYSELQTPIPANTLNLTAYFFCYPFTLNPGDKFVVMVETDGNEVFTKEVIVPETLTDGIKFQRGKGTEFSVNMASSQNEACVFDGSNTFKYYSSLSDALAYAKTKCSLSNPVTVQLTSNVIISDRFDIRNTTDNIVLDLNGCTLELNEYRPYVCNGTLTVTNSKPATGGIIQEQGDKSFYVTYGDLVIEDGVYIEHSGASAAVYAIGGTVTFNGGIVESGCNCLYLSKTQGGGHATAYIYGGTFSSYSNYPTVSVKSSAECYIDGGSFRTDYAGPVINVLTGSVEINGGYYHVYPSSNACIFKRQYNTSPFQVTSAYSNIRIDPVFIAPSHKVSVLSSPVQHAHGDDMLEYGYEVSDSSTDIVAKTIDNTGDEHFFDDINEAFIYANAIPDSCTIQILEDVGYNGDLNVENENGVVKIDLNGHNLQATRLYIDSHSSAVLTDSGDGGSITSTTYGSNATVENVGTFRMEGGKVRAYTNVALGNYGTFVMNGGELDGKGNIAFVNYASAIISGGLLKGNFACVRIANPGVNSMCSIYGGYFSTAGSVVDFVATTQGEAKVYGGYFSLQPDDGLIAEGKEITDSGDSTYPYMVVDEIPADAVVRLNSTPYVNIKDAVAAFNSSTSDCTMTLLSDINATSTLKFDNGSVVTLTIDLNGHVLNSHIWFEGSYITVNIIDSGTGGAIVSERDPVISCECGMDLISGTVKGLGTASAILLRYNAWLDIHGGSVVSEGPTAIYLETYNPFLRVLGGSVSAQDQCIFGVEGIRATLLGGSFQYNKNLAAGERSVLALAGHFSKPVESKYFGEDFLGTRANTLDTDFDPDIKYALETISDGPAEVEVDSRPFTHLSEAMIYAKEVSSPDNPCTVKLLKNLTLQSKLTIEENNNIVLDLNGKELTASASHYSNQNYIDITGGHLTVEDTAESGSYVVAVTGYPCPGFSVQNGGELVVESGSFTGNGYSALISSSAGSNVTINGGTFTNSVYSISMSGSVTINDGSFRCTATSNGSMTGVIQHWANSHLTVNGGYFYNNVEESSCIGGSGSDIVINSIITNTLLNGNYIVPGKYLVHIAAADDARTHMHGSSELQYDYTVSSNLGAMAKFGTDSRQHYYSTIEDAVDACNAAQDSSTICLLGETRASKKLFFSNTNAKMTLDLCSQKLEANVFVKKDVTFKLISSTGGGQLTKSGAVSTLANNGGNVTIDIHDGVLHSTGGNALDITASGNTTVLSGTIESVKHFRTIVNSGNLTIEDGARVISDEYAISLSSQKTADATVINGGTFKVGKGLLIRTINGCSAVVNGGLFSRPVESQYLPENKANVIEYRIVDSRYGYYCQLTDIEPGSAPAEVSSCRFATVREALTCAEVLSDETTPFTVKLLKDCVFPGASVSHPKNNVIFDLNGKTMTGSAGYPIFAVMDGKFVLKNSVPATGGLVQTNVQNSIFTRGGECIVENVVINQNTPENSQPLPVAAVEVHGGHFTMNDGVIRQDGEDCAVSITSGLGTFNDVTINSQYYCFYVNNSGNAVINGGVYTSVRNAQAAVVNMTESKITINGGSFKSGASNAIGAVNGTINVNGGYFYTGVPGVKTCFYKSPNGTLTINSAYGNTDIDAGYIGAGKTKSTCSVVHNHGSEALTYTTKVE